MWTTLTASNQAEFRPPHGEVLGVNYSPQGGLRDLAMFFVSQDATPVWHVASLNGQPTSVKEVKGMLKKVYRAFNLPCWTVFEDCLIIWPPAINAGDILIVELADGADQS